MTNPPDPLPIAPLTRPFDLTVTPPGSKSLTCRAYVLAALAGGTSRILRPLRADDTDALLAALCTLGAAAEWSGEDVAITGTGGRFPRGGSVDLGDGGAPSRFMIAAACLADEPVVVDGSPRMRQRPVAEGVELLRRLGARIDYVGDDARLPVRVTPAPLSGGALDVGRTQSSQFISALMLIAPWLPEPLRLQLGPDVTSASYVRLTEHVLRQWGAPETPTARTYAVEPDASAATYFLAAAALVPGAAVRIDGLASSSPQGDAGFARLLAAAGAVAEDDPVGIRHGGPLRGVACDMADMPDAAPTLAAALATASSPSTIAGLETLRVKESDRLAALAAELSRIGCRVETTPDSITIDPAGHDPGRPAEPVTFETYGDHRMAMALALIGLVRPGISVADPACVSKSYPAFWRDLARLYD